MRYAGFWRRVVATVIDMCLLAPLVLGVSAIILPKPTPEEDLAVRQLTIGRLTGAPTVDPDTRYLAWHLSIPVAGGTELQALCRTNVILDRNLLSAGAWVEVRGVAVGAQASDASNGAAVYVETVQAATAPAATPTT